MATRKTGTSRSRSSSSRSSSSRRADPGYINVRVGLLPGRIDDIALNGDRTVAAALTAAQLDCSGYQIKVNGQDAGTGDSVKEGDTVLLVRKVSGA